MTSHFARTLKERRLQRGLTLDELAERAGCTKGYLSNVERATRPPPTDELVQRLEAALGLEHDTLGAIARWQRTPEPIKRDLERLTRTEARVHSLLRALETKSLDEVYRSGELATHVNHISPPPTWPLGDADDTAGATSVHRFGPVPRGGVEIPLINAVSAGYPADFTDLGYPARVADEYVRAPDLDDPDAFAARVVGDSMEPDYRAGDIVIFSPALAIEDGHDCFVRLEPDHESTFKRIYFETGAGGEELIRIQPVNNRYPPRTVEREQVAGLYRAARLLRSLG